MLADDHEAEDVFQATWLVFVRRAAAIRRPDRLANWIYGVAHKVAIRARSQTARRRVQELEMQPAIQAPDPVRVETERILHEELNHLPEQFRLPLVLCYLQGYRKEEAAAILGWSLGTLHGRLERGRHRLRRRLKGRGLGLSAAGVVAVLEAQASAASLPLALARATTTTVFSYLTHSVPASGAVSPAALTLTEGVCRTMQLAQFKLVVLFIIAAGLVGGAGLFVVRGEDAAAAADPAARSTSGQEPPQTKLLAQAGENPAQGAGNAQGTDWAKDAKELRHLEQEMDEAEAIWSEEVQLERAKVLDRERALQQVTERYQERQQEIRIAEQHAQQRMSLAQKELETSKAAPPTSPVLDAAKREYAAVRVVAENERRQYAKEWLDAQLAFSAVRDRLDLVERRQARKRAQMEADLDAVQQRIRQARWGIAPSAPVQNERLERKVDQLRKEIEELRKQLRRGEHGAGVKP
jgi:RNA polymerase sigma factor (sigma-70 family)